MLDNVSAPWKCMEKSCARTYVKRVNMSQTAFSLLLISSHRIFYVHGGSFLLLLFPIYCPFFRSIVVVFPFPCTDSDNTGNLRYTMCVLVTNVWTLRPSKRQEFLFWIIHRRCRVYERKCRSKNIFLWKEWGSSGWNIFS